MDYGSQAVLAASLVVKHLNVPVSLVADITTINNVKSKFKVLPFDQLIEITNDSTNQRVLAGEKLPFFNGSRSLAYSITPYDRTLVIDSDFLVFSDTLGKFWDDPHDFLITPGMMELQQETHSYTDYRISPNSIRQLWATNIMFSKTPEVEILFNLVNYIKEEYSYFSQLYEFDSRQFRNDFAFSIACFTMNGFPEDMWHGELPVPLFYRDTDEILKVDNDGSLVFLLKRLSGDDYALTKCQGQDVHIMNKRSLLANLDKLLELSK
jgi:hypothetical protein